MEIRHCSEGLHTCSVCSMYVPSQFSSVHFDLITLEYCISSVVEVFMQVLGPTNRGWRWLHHWTHLSYPKWHCSNLFSWKSKFLFKAHHPSTNKSYLKSTAEPFENSDPFKGSPGSHSQSVSCSVGIMNSCISVLGQPCVIASTLLCSSVPLTHNCARLLIVAIPVLKAAMKSAKRYMATM